MITGANIYPLQYCQAMPAPYLIAGGLTAQILAHEALAWWLIRLRHILFWSLLNSTLDSMKSMSSPLIYHKWAVLKMLPVYSVVSNFFWKLWIELYFFMKSIHLPQSHLWWSVILFHWHCIQVMCWLNLILPGQAWNWVWLTALSSTVFLKGTMISSRKFPLTSKDHL